MFSEAAVDDSLVFRMDANPSLALLKNAPIFFVFRELSYSVANDVAEDDVLF